MNNTAPRSMTTSRVWAIELLVWAGIGAILGAVGPFGSFFNGGLGVRVVYWTTVCLVSGVAIGATVRTLSPLARRRGLPAWIWIPVAAVAITAPLGLFARVFATGLWPGIRERVSLGEWYVQTLLIEAVFLGLYVAFHRRTAGRVVSASTSTDAEDRSRILDRLPPGLGRDLLCLQMEDHYVRVHTAEGSMLVLTPLRTAIGQLGPVDGIQVHRSWWVARDAVAGAIRDGRSLRLKLVSGLEAPVARSRVAALKAAGWPVGAD